MKKRILLLRKILLNLPKHRFQFRIRGSLPQRHPGISQKRTLLTIKNIILSFRKKALLHQSLLYLILNPFHIRNIFVRQLFLNRYKQISHNRRRRITSRTLKSLPHSPDNFLPVIILLTAISFHDIHVCLLFPGL